MLLPFDLSAEACSIVDTFNQARRPGAKPRSCYQDLPSTCRLRYQLLSWQNYRYVLNLFADDPNPFVMPFYREQEALDKYVAYQLALGRYSGKHGSCDWLLFREDNSCIGILHLHDVSYELWDGRRSPCAIGYAIGQSFRRQGYAEEALQNLLKVLPSHFLLFDAEATVLLGNEPSEYLLQKVGFTYRGRTKSEWGASAYWSYKTVKRRRKLTTIDMETFWR